MDYRRYRSTSLLIIITPLNVKKTECMVISKKAIAPSCNLQSRGQQIKLAKKFKYLGYMITSDGKCITEIKKRIATAKDAFKKLSLILKNRNISMTTKFRLLKTYAWSTLTYGCECWTITSDIEKKIEAAEMWFIRRMLRISWIETQCKCIERGECSKITIENN